MDKQALITVLLTGLIFLTVKSIISLESSKNRTIKVRNKIQNSRQLNTSLETKIKESTNNEYIEKIAIEKLNMTKDGYRIIIDNNTTNLESQNEDKKTMKNKNTTNLELWKKKFNL